MFGSIKRRAHVGGLILAAACASLCSCATKLESLDYYNGITITEPDLSAKADGVYRGEYTVHPPFGVIVANPRVSVEVEIAARRYKDIEITKPASWESMDSIRGLRGRILEGQSLEAVNAVSGATLDIGYTGKAYLKAIEAAVR